MRGEPARFPTLLYRKHGFNRSDAVEHAAEHFSEVVLRAHPEFYGEKADVGRFGWHSGPGVSIKARWRPGLSVIALAPVTDAEQLRTRAAAQSCADFELLVRSDEPLADLDAGPALRRIPAALARTAAAAMVDGLAAARSDRVLVLSGSPEAALADGALIEKLLRAQFARPAAPAIVLADAGAAGRYPLRELGPEESLPEPHGLLVPRDAVGGYREVDEARPVGSLVRASLDADAAAVAPSGAGAANRPPPLTCGGACRCRG